MLRQGRTGRGFAADIASTAAVEFAIVLPLIFLLLAGVYDFSEAAIIRAEIYNAAETIAASASSVAVQSDGSTALTWAQVEQAESMIWALVPTLRSGQKAGNPKSINVTSVLFFPDFATTCNFHVATPCQYNADLVWSVAYAPSSSYGTFNINLPYDCSTVFGAGAASSDQVSATAPLSGTNNISNFRTLDISTLTAMAGGYPANEGGVPPLIVVTIEYTYTPLFNLYITKPFTFWVDAYWPVRSVKKATPITLTIAGNSDIVPPLSNQFTTLVGTPASGGAPASLSGSPTVGSYCFNGNINPQAISSAVN
jgi:hypothetical protein